MQLWKRAFAAIILTFSAQAGAVIIDNGSYTTDTVNGLDWLDLTETNGMSYNQVLAQLGTGRSLDGWRYATESEIVGFMDAFGGDSNYYDGWSTQNNGLFDAMAPYWGDTYCESITSCASVGDGYSWFLYDGVYTSGNVTTRGVIYDWTGSVESPLSDLIDLPVSGYWGDDSALNIGSALVRDVAPVPVPASIWLMLSGLLGLATFVRRSV